MRNIISIHLTDENLKDISIRARYSGMSRSKFVEDLIEKNRLLHPLNELSGEGINKATPESNLKDRLDDIIEEEKKELGIPEGSEKNEKSRRSYF